MDWTVEEWSGVACADDDMGGVVVPDDVESDEGVRDEEDVAVTEADRDAVNTAQDSPGWGPCGPPIRYGDPGYSSQSGVPGA